MNIFKGNKVAKKEIKRHCGLVCYEDVFSSPNEWCEDFGTAVSNDDALERAIREICLKHVMLGKESWNSLTSYFQVELFESDDESKIKEYCYGVLLWAVLIKHAYPTTKVSSLNHKDDLYAMKLKDFDFDVKKCNFHFERKRRDIIRDEGGDTYLEHIRQLFKTYLTATNKDFVDSIKKERRHWLLDLKPDEHSCKG